MIAIAGYDKTFDEAASQCAAQGAHLCSLAEMNHAYGAGYRRCEYGYRVEVLHPGAEKAVEGTEVRRRIASGERWEELVPTAVARVIRRLPEID